MADVKISALPAATTPLAGTEVLPIVQGGTTDKVSVANLTAGRSVAAAGLAVDANSSSTAVRITQLGSGNAFVVEDDTSPDASPFVINNSGSVGVGVTSPSFKVDVTGDGRFSSDFLVGGTVAGATGLNVAAGFNIVFSEGSANTAYATIFRQASSAAHILAYGYKFSATANGFASSVAVSIGRSAIAVDNGAIKFYVNTASNVAVGTDITPTERGRFTSAGEFLVGVTTANAAGGVTITPSATIPNVHVRGSSTSNSDSTLQVYSSGASAYRFYVGFGGTIYATSTTISAISDQRLKENIRDLDVGLNEIMALKPRKFDWKAGKGKDKKDDRGWIAQELEQVFPDMIDVWADPAPEGEEPYKSVNADLIPVLVKAIQELKAELDAVKAKLG